MSKGKNQIDDVFLRPKNQQQQQQQKNPKFSSHKQRYREFLFESFNSAVGNVFLEPKWKWMNLTTIELNKRGREYINFKNRNFKNKKIKNLYDFLSSVLASIFCVPLKKLFKKKKTTR